MKLDTAQEKEKRMVILALSGVPLSEISKTQDISRAGAGVAVKRIISGIYRLTRKDEAFKAYSLNDARQDKEFLITHLDSYLSGELVDSKKPKITSASPLADLWLSPRESNPLATNNISTVGELLRLSKQNLLAMDGFGRASLKKLVSALNSQGVKHSF